MPDHDLELGCVYVERNSMAIVARRERSLESSALLGVKASMYFARAIVLELFLLSNHPRPSHLELVVTASRPIQFSPYDPCPCRPEFSVVHVDQHNTLEVTFGVPVQRIFVPFPHMSVDAHRP